MHTYAYSLYALMLGVISFGSSAQETPRSGILYNMSEVHSLTYNCTTSSNNTLNCEFVQTSVRPKATYADLPAALEHARKEFAKGPMFDSKDCNLNQTLINILSGKEKAPKQDVIDKLTTVQRRDMLALAQAALGVCSSRSEEKYFDLIRLGQDRDRRTCKVSSHPFSQTFRATSEGGSSTGVWVAQGKPEGPCGIVQLSRFESEQIKIGSSLFTNWRFIARKAISNPSGKLFLGGSCSRLDEQPYTYDWRTQEHQLTCDYVDLSPL